MRIQATALLAVLLTAGQALGHALLGAATPEAGAIGPAPTQVSLGFSGILEPRLSRITVTAPDDAAVADAASLVPADDRRRMVLNLPKLAPGIYTVKWVAVSIDTHRTEGSYRFTVTP